MGRTSKSKSLRGQLSKAKEKIESAVDKIEAKIETISEGREDRQERRDTRKDVRKNNRLSRREAIREGVQEGLAEAKDVLENLVDSVEERLDNGRTMAMQSTARIDVRIYPTTGDRFQFPETRNTALSSKPNVGLAFSGGGTRSASLSIGQLRSLSDAGLIACTRYLGSNSGGTWATLPFTYLPSTFSDEDYLGPSIDPGKMTAQRAKSEDDIGLAGRSIIASEIVLQTLFEIAMSEDNKALFKDRGMPILNLSFGMDDADEIYGKILERVFLSPLGIDGSRYPVLDTDEINDILQRNSNIRLNAHLEESDFIAVQHDRPFHCVSGCMNQDYINALDDEPAGDENRLGFLNWEHVEFTPSYSGIHRHSRGKLNLNVGGGYVENIGWDTLLPTPRGDDIIRVSPGLEFHRLTLADIMATSGAAPAFVVQYLNDIGGGIAKVVGALFPGAAPVTEKIQKFLGAIDIFPRFRNWPVAFNRKPIAVERAFGDGGYVDSYGLIPLLKRRVETAIVFINTNTPITRNEEFPNGIAVDTTLHGLFGQNLSLSEANIIDVGARMAPGSTFSEFDGQVFESGFEEMIAGFVRTKRLAALSTSDGSEIEGPLDAESLSLLDLPDTVTAEEMLGLVHGPIYHLGEYDVRDNQFYGIVGGYRIKILWVYNERSQAWRDQLEPSARALLQDADVRIGRDPNADPLDPLPYVDDDRRRNTPLGNFPHLSTFLTGRNEDRMRVMPIADIRDVGVTAGLMRWLNRFHDRIEPIAVDPVHFNLLSNYSSWCMKKLVPLIRADFE